jgi:hypothetical protein
VGSGNARPDTDVVGFLMRRGGEGMSEEPRPEGSIVELTTVESYVEAEALIGTLEDAGIKAIRGTDEAGGWLPNLAASGGYRVLVFDDDLEAARRIVAQS